MGRVASPEQRQRILLVMNRLIIRDALAGDAAERLAFLIPRWSEIVVTRGQPHHLADLPALVARRNGVLVGVLTYRQDGPSSLEVVTLDAALPRQGIGRALAQAAQARTEHLWLITTNDNLEAQAFYQRLGFTLKAVHQGAVTEARRLKPTIPLTGLHGLPLEDELEYHWTRMLRA